ncbi:E2 ubiquitin-protein ligase peroxin 4 [Basidiobolus ranarum]|uniref:E2 ubiquitin-protein ligase peroxin 4 n=1 Tax=Basidiobolus ranarum TaxID=34480 RepID=A0ABR2W699_9FUNG
MDPVSRRLLKELSEFRRQPISELKELEPMADNDLMTWKATLLGQKETLYEGGEFELLINIPHNYPIYPPNIKFLTRVCHPNVHFKTGEICLDILKTAWSPAWTLQSTCLAISLLLSNPEPSSPLNCDAANLLRCEDQLGYNSLVRMYTQLYAMNE